MKELTSYEQEESFLKEKISRAAIDRVSTLVMERLEIKYFRFWIN